MNENALIIFIKNSVYGKVKTRLASTIGNEKALDIYRQLIKYTYLLTKAIKTDKIVFYDTEIIIDDVWKNDYKKQLQQGNNLGEKMLNAFQFCFDKSYNYVVIIGTDCAELTTPIINQAFQLLHKHEVVIGPAADGGYYLLGMKKMYNHLFKNIEWSTSTVLSETLECCKAHHLSYFLLDELHDIDEEKDLVYMKNIL